MGFRFTGARARQARVGLSAAVMTIFMSLGCGNGGQSDTTASSAPSAPQTASTKTDDGVAAAAPSKSSAAMPKAKLLSQSFAEATISEDDAPEGQILPAETMTGKSVGKLFTDVKALWSQIPLASASGKTMSCSAILDTEVGVIQIDFLPDIAPNHVRNFLALARAGYFHGLLFERKHHEESDVEPGEVLEYIEAGCPMGNGDENFGSIGYWLKPELSDKVRHEAGTVGAWHKEEADTAACKFYITLTKAPVMDGNFTIFGKVTRGLDVVREIAKRPTRQEEDLKDRPANPVMIKKVTIRVDETR